MKPTFLLIALMLTSTGALSQNASTSIYESEKEAKKTKSFTAKVRMASEDDGGWSVYFEGDQHKGVFFLSNKLSEFGAYTGLIEESRKAKGPALNFTVDDEKNIEKIGKPDKPSHEEPDPNKKWKFGS